MSGHDDFDEGRDAPQRKRKRRWAKRLGWALAILLAPFLLAAAFFSSPIGKRFVTDQIAQVSPASGLRFKVGRIEGDLYGEAVLHDVIVMDPRGTFLTIPVVELDWRPLAWLWSGLDIRELVIRRGTLERMPELLPGDPDAPLLPDFDIRIDRFEIERLMLARGVAGERPQRVDFLAEVDIREGRALIDAEGRLGTRDTVDLLLDAIPAENRFDLAFDYRAAEDGPIAAMVGLDSAYRARIAGDGTWSRWLGHALVTQRESNGEGEPQSTTLAAFRVTNDGGEYGLLGQYFPDMGGSSLVARALGESVSVALSGTLEESVFDGAARAVTSSLDLAGKGVLDLAGNEAEDFAMRAILRDPELIGDTARLENAQLAATIDGAFRDLVIDHRLTVGTLAFGDTATLRRLVQTGTATYDGTRLTVPLNLEVARVVTGSDFVDPRLVGGILRGTLTYTGDRLLTDRLRIAFPGLDAQLALRGDLSDGAYRVAGPVAARGITIPDVGLVSGTGDIDVRFGSAPWRLEADLDGRLTEVSNTTVANLAGEQVRFSGVLNMGGNRPIALRDVVLDSERLDARLDSRIEDGRTILAGSGEHVEYGPFTFDGVIDGEGPRGELVLADPLPAAGLADVRVGISPSEDGFALDVSGGSLLGPFDGELGLALPGGGAPTRIDIDRLRVYRTNVTGALTLGDGGISGDLALAGGGLDGTVSILPGPGDAQRFDADIRARNARFGGETEIALRRADIDASGTFGGARGLTVDASIEGGGLQYGGLSIANFAADAAIEDGRGNVTGAIAGRRQDRFSLKFDGNFAPDRIALIAQGEYAGRAISMPRRAVLTPLDNGGYRLARTQVGYAGGFTIMEGRIGGGVTAVEAKLSQMPLRLIDIAGSELGLGGRLSGVIEWNQRENAPATGNARVRIDDFTRSGLVLSSRPIDVYAVADLRPERLVAGARLLDGEAALGRFDARITGLQRNGGLATRLGNGRLAANLRYNGAADALWRLVAVEAFDLTGPIRVEARARGTLNNPRITGNLASDDLRLQSAISGTEIVDVTARGRFAGSRLEIVRFAGSTEGGGTITGSGSVDLATIGAGRGPRIDLRAAASDARLLDANGIEATITGPLRIVSSGIGGTIAGRVSVDRASWSLGTADEDRALPRIATREINGEGTNASNSVDPGASAWRYLVDARARSRFAVDGLGLDSEWGIDIALRGTVDDPRIGGEARLVRGDYTFAGTRFELTRGRIAFDRDQPIDPRLDIEAETTASGTSVTIDITGNAQSPEIAFSSTPALPEEEILARLLFGGSVTSLSATDALQLGAALASLQGGGGGLDPIGELRNSIGLDQLRIVSADPALGRGTGVALGKNLGRRFYVELVTDGQGYTATQVEYRVTRWLALLATVTTIGRDSALVEVSRDY
ncbi:translocation/assembly module TamB domain-containing protein [Erythrobacter sp.]|uniref:translocation/assembly module TamB domain-containing protein n=1 Tax=Erythrobacter sp. TaxID=1042 RepID=UPI003C775694